jgi:hypothetical protein
MAKEETFGFVGGNRSVELRVEWGNSTLKVVDLDPPRSFTVGNGGDCDCYLPIDAVEIIRVEGDDVLLMGETLEFDEEKTVELGGITFRARLGVPGEMVVGSFQLGNGTWFQGVSALVHAAFLGAIFYYNPLLNPTEDGTISEEQRLVLSQYLTTSAEKEEKRLESEVNNPVSGGDVGGRSKGSEGNMGNSSSKPSNSRYTVKGPKDNPDPHISRQAALKDAQDFGMVGLLGSIGGDPDSPTSPWGRDDSLGKDAVSFNGSLWGDQPGDNFGSNGLGLSGIGEGSGGPGEGIGVGPNIGGLGNNMHHGFGPPGVLSKKYVPKEIKMRQSSTSVSGRIPPEVIQRIVRQNFGRFRACYETGLRNNPSLSGRVAVRFVVGRDGSVSNVGNGGSDLPDGGVVNCVVNSFRGLSFPAPEEGIVTVGYSLQFSPG